MESRYFLEKNFLTVVPETNVEDAQLTVHFNNSRPLSNVSICEIEHASQTNDATAHFEGFNRQLNDASQRQQELLFEAKLAEFNERYRQSRSATARSHMYHELTREVDMLEQEEQREDEVQDPPEMTGPRTFGRGGPRRKTGAELAMEELEKCNKPTSQSQHQNQPSVSQKTFTFHRRKPFSRPFVHATNIHDGLIQDGLISGAHLPAEELARFVIEREARLAAQLQFNSTRSTPPLVDLMHTSSIVSHPPLPVTSVIETISQSQIGLVNPCDPPLVQLAQSVYIIPLNPTQIRSTNWEIEIVEVWNEEELQAESNSISHYRLNIGQQKLKCRVTEISSQTSPTQTKRNVGLSYMYCQGKGMLVQPPNTRE